MIKEAACACEQKHKRRGAYTSERHGAERRFDSDDKNAWLSHIQNSRGALCLQYVVSDARRCVCSRADIILTAVGDLLFIRARLLSYFSLFLLSHGGGGGGA